MKRALLVIGCMAMTIILTAGCPKKKRPPQPPIPPPVETLPAMPEQPAQPQPQTQPQTPPPVTPKPVGSELKTIHFDFDKHDIRPADATILDNNGAWMRNNAAVKVTLEGYCDPIGTEEYNRGLGMRRAVSARNYLLKLGLDASRFSTISYGKDKLVTTDSTQYELDRRVEFKPQ